MSKEKYFNFPIQLLSGFIKNSDKAISNIKDYAIYENALKLDHGNELQKIKDSASFFNIKLGNIERTFENGKELYESIPTKSPKVGVSFSIWRDFYENDKTEFEKVCLLGFLGIKSILGTKAFCKMDNKNWLSRMDGQIKSVDNLLLLSEEIRKYANEYQTKKIKTALRNNWGLITYSRHTRGFYVSFNISLKQLVLEAEKRRISTKEKQYKEQEKAIINEVLNQLKTAKPN